MTYEGINRLWLRWLTLEGELIPIPSEVANAAQQEAADATALAMQAEQRAMQAEQEAAEAKQRAERLAAKLRELNIDPDRLD